MGTKQSTKVDCEVIENEGPNTLRAYLARELPKVMSADLAVAFITDAGLDRLHSALAAASERGHVRILTGIYQGVTEPNALWWARDTQIKTGGRLKLKLSPQPRFHWKLYILHYARKTVVIAGSANFTQDGLTEAGEFCVATTFRAHSSDLARIESAFEDAWKESPQVLDKDQIVEYARQRGKNPPMKHPSFDLKKIIKKKPHPRKPGKGNDLPPPDKGFWRDHIDGIAKKATKAAVRNDTNWEKLGYDWFAAGVNKFCNGDHVLFFDFPDRMLYMAEVKSSTQIRHLPDGPHFVAYKRLGRYKKLSPKLWTTLKKLKLLKSKKQASECRKVNPDKWTLFSNLLQGTSR
jgi:HKD family nuclease